jgi:hypothetical protein
MYVSLGGHTEPRTNRINPRTTCSHRSQRTLRAHRTQRVSVPSAATASCWHLPPGVFVPAARQHPHRFASHFPAGWPSSANNSPIFYQRALVTWPRPPVLASPPTAAVAGADRIRTGRGDGRRRRCAAAGEEGAVPPRVPRVPGGPAERGAGGRVPVPGPLPHLARHRLLQYGLFLPPFAPFPCFLPQIMQCLAFIFMFYLLVF